MQSNNSATLIGHYGGDKLTAVVAWSSTGLSTNDLNLIPATLRLDEVYQNVRGSKKNNLESLITMLASEGHTAPFRHSHLTFIITSDIATHIQMLKHRIGVEIGSESARWKELQDNYYVPSDIPEWAQDHIRLATESALASYHDLITRLTPVVGRSRAKDAARYLLPYSKQITYTCTLSFFALVHLYNLRAGEDSHAQYEIRDIAKEMVAALRMATSDFDLSLAAFNIP